MRRVAVKNENECLTLYTCETVNCVALTLKCPFAFSFILDLPQATSGSVPLQSFQRQLNFFSSGEKTMEFFVVGVMTIWGGIALFALCAPVQNHGHEASGNK